MKQVHFDIEISGRVHGVGFRAGARREAVKLGLSGWVTNTPQGTVQIEVEGEPGAVAKFASWCQQGPMLARVDKIQIKKSKQLNYPEFSIRK